MYILLILALIVIVLFFISLQKKLKEIENIKHNYRALIGIIFKVEILLRNGIQNNDEKLIKKANYIIANEIDYWYLLKELDIWAKTNMQGKPTESKEEMLKVVEEEFRKQGLFE